MHSEHYHHTLRFSSDDRVLVLTLKSESDSSCVFFFPGFGWVLVYLIRKLFSFSDPWINNQLLSKNLFWILESCCWHWALHEEMIAEISVSLKSILGWSINSSKTAHVLISSMWEQFTAKKQVFSSTRNTTSSLSTVSLGIWLIQSNCLCLFVCIVLYCFSLHWIPQYREWSAKLTQQPSFNTA